MNEANNYFAVDDAKRMGGMLEVPSGISTSHIFFSLSFSFSLQMECHCVGMCNKCARVLTHTHAPISRSIFCKLKQKYKILNLALRCFCMYNNELNWVKLQFIYALCTKS